VFDVADAALIVARRPRGEVFPWPQRFVLSRRGLAIGVRKLVGVEESIMQTYRQVNATVIDDCWWVRCQSMCLVMHCSEVVCVLRVRDFGHCREGIPLILYSPVS
jgi:hypothetical protein